MLHRGHLYVGHMFSDGVTVLDARDPRALKPVHFFSTAPNTRTHHLQVAEGLMLLANGANIVRMQSYDSTRDYFENTLADSLTNRQPFRAGLSIFDLDRNPAAPREIAFLPMPGSGVNRLWWAGGRYAYVSAHFDGFTDHILAIVDLADVTSPKIVSRWWLPGMHRAGGETPTAPQGRRYALHHMIVAGNRGYAAWRDGGLTIHDVGDAANPKLLSQINWSPPYPGGTHTALPLPNRQLVVVADESNATTAPGVVLARRRARGGQLPSRRCRRPPGSTSARWATSARTTCTKTGRAASSARTRSSRPTTMPAYACSTFAINIDRQRSRRGCRRCRSACSIRGRASRAMR
jgi:hypothetical protein